METIRNVGVSFVMPKIGQKSILFTHPESVVNNATDSFLGFLVVFIKITWQNGVVEWLKRGVVGDDIIVADCMAFAVITDMLLHPDTDIHKMKMFVYSPNLMEVLQKTGLKNNIYCIRPIIVPNEDALEILRFQGCQSLAQYFVPVPNKPGIFIGMGRSVPEEKDVQAWYDDMIDGIKRFGTNPELRLAIKHMRSIRYGLVSPDLKIERMFAWKD